MEALLFDHKSSAGYLLQVNLVHRARSQALLGSFNFFSKTGRFGTMDNLMLLCPAPGCKGLFRDEFRFTDVEQEYVDLHKVTAYKDWPATARARYDGWQQQLVECTMCHMRIPRNELMDSYGFNTAPSRIAELMTYFFEVLGRNADIYLVRTREDLVFQRAKQQLVDTGSRHQYGKMLAAAREREQVLYPLERIVADTAVGSLERRFLALLGA